LGDAFQATAFGGGSLLIAEVVEMMDWDKNRNY
jgi:hypothetical protein